MAKRIRDDIAPKVAADKAFQNARNNTPHSARMAHGQALGKVMQILLKDDTQGCKPFVENESFRRFVGDMVYQSASQPHIDRHGRRQPRHGSRTDTDALSQSVTREGVEVQVESGNEEEGAIALACLPAGATLRARQVVRRQAAGGRRQAAGGRRQAAGGRRAAGGGGGRRPGTWRSVR